jgi:hypothetical protein
MLSLACRHIYNDFKVHISSRHAIDTASSTCNSNKTCDPRPSRIPHHSDHLLTFPQFQSRPGEGRLLRSRSSHKLHLDPDEIRLSQYHQLWKVASDPNLQQSTSITLPVHRKTLLFIDFTSRCPLRGMFILEASVHRWCIGVQSEMKMSFFLGHGTQAKWQMPSIGLSYRPIALPPSLVQNPALPLAKQHISFVAPTTRPGMVLPTMPQSLLNSIKEKMLPWICAEGEAGN